MVEITQNILQAEDYWHHIYDPACGVVVTFLGVVRNLHNGRTVQRIFYECYESMTLKMMQRIEAEVQKSWPDMHLILVHRIGMVELTEASILVITASPHRKEAYAANAYVMDRVKQILPVWKREYHPDNQTSWVGIGS